MIRVAVAGALGKMGRVACAAIATADGMQLAGGFARAHAGEPLRSLAGLDVEAGIVYDDLGAFYAGTRPDVVVDFTVHPATVEVARAAVAAGVSPVIGATGWTSEERRDLAERCAAARVGAALVPNFALGAVLMMRFAEEAARYFPSAEIVELHHDRKRDKPSGTARLTAERMAAAAGRDVPIHSVRLRGLVAHQEVLLGGEGELLTLRHDSLSRESFAAGILLAVRAVRNRPGLVVGLDSFMEPVAS